MTMAANPFMELALAQATIAYEKGEVPVGAVVVSSTGEVLSSAYNLVITQKDPTAHAELLAIRSACAKMGSERLTDCDLYVTLEPCAMCAQAISFARIRRLYYGASDPKGGGVEHGARVFSHPTCHHRPELYSAIGEHEAAALLKKFFQTLRN